MARRILRLLLGLVLYGIGCGLTIRAGWGVDPWTVLAEGLSGLSGIGVGWVTNILGALVLLAWIPLRQRPGIGTLANVLVVGSVIQVTITVVPVAPDPWWGAALLALGVIVVAIASAVYIGAGLGPGPRDGLMTGLHSRLGWPIWLCRLLVEGTVLLIGWMLGGTVGVGTVVFALCIGPLVHVAMALLAPDRPRLARTDSVAPAGVSALGTPAATPPA